MRRKKTFLEIVCNPQKKLKFGQKIEVRNNGGGVDTYYETMLVEDWYGEKVKCPLCDAEIKNMYEYYTLLSQLDPGFVYCHECTDFYKREREGEKL